MSRSITLSRMKSFSKKGQFVDAPLGWAQKDPFGLTVSAIVIGEMISSMAPCFALSRMR